MPKPPKNFNILSLDGGGVRGTIEAILLNRLLSYCPRLIRDTDLLTGTSTGGIQALGLAAGMPTTDLRDLYENAAKIIFADCFLDDFRDAWKLRGADYSDENLEKILRLQFGDMTLRDLNKKVAITAFELDNNRRCGHRSWKFKVFHNFEGDDCDGDELVVDVALRTSAAPTYFPSKDRYVDGGVVANNPALVGIAQALDKRGANKPLSEINLLSLGTGRFERYIEGEDLDWGILHWAPHLLYMMMEGGVDVVDFQCQQILGKKYHRINPLLHDKFSLDNWKKIPKMVEIAEKFDLQDTIDWLEDHWQ